ncbi:MAG: hypothetical protein IK066_11695, partial [Kiritimatiellae bacterium]|nr:hypothetical protein [Kiritimatiellia bacterium]
MSEESKTEETIESLLPEPETPIGQLAIDERVAAEMDKSIEADLAEMDGGGGETGTDGGQAPEPPARQDAAPPNAGEPPAPPAETKPDDAEARAKALAEERAAAGRWGAEKQAYEKQLKEMREEIDALKAGGKAEGTPKAEPAKAAKPEEVTDADLDAELGEDWRDNYSRDEAVRSLLRERAREERAAQKALAEVNARLAAEKAEAAKAAEAEAAAAEARASLHAAVRSLVPEADALDEDPKFNEYLAQPLPGTLGTRLDAARAAMRSA